MSQIFNCSEIGKESASKTSNAKPDFMQECYGFGEAAARAADVMIVGTVKGAVESTVKNIRENPGQVCLEVAGNVALGAVAGATLPECAAFGLGVLGAASMCSYGARLYPAFMTADKAAYRAFKSASNMDEAENKIAESLGPLMAEGAGYAVMWSGAKSFGTLVPHLRAYGGAIDGRRFIENPCEATTPPGYNAFKMSTGAIFLPKQPNYNPVARFEELSKSIRRAIELAKENNKLYEIDYELGKDGRLLGTRWTNR